ncbi:SprT family zinc-dependent metalloprotease [Aestuariibacter sp. AA17]|uniref:Protein SprT n=1 Tax=Fluctibacter corallii TaxID=2984329 RepID=A0ABT3A6F5_9ALTE|nr:SprT family zinc-dependent metalloprotease [Aestuariibacter sp. AA17]MCV2884261.1 SprT family zinc-dependent metalloprotease [Aestuariibacter sp. AA17]
MNDLISIAEERINQCYSIANGFFNQHFPLPTVSLNQRGKIAGSANFQRNHIKLNPVLFSENRSVFESEVIPHEVAHLITYHLYGKVKPHGKEWQNIMTQVFYLPATATHQLCVKNVQGKTFSYKCDCQTISLTVRRHNKIIRGESQYRCKRCNAVLVAAG